MLSRQACQPRYCWSRRSSREMLLFTNSTVVAPSRSVNSSSMICWFEGSSSKVQVNASRWEIWIPGVHNPGGHGDIIDQTTVSSDYFKTIGVAIVEGRAFTDADRPDTPRVAIVNETMARRYWPGQSAIGKTLRSSDSIAVRA